MLLNQKINGRGRGKGQSAGYEFISLQASMQPVSHQRCFLRADAVLGALPAPGDPAQPCKGWELARPDHHMLGLRAANAIK